MSEIKWCTGKRKISSSSGYFDFYATYTYPIKTQNGDTIIPCAIRTVNYYVGDKGNLPYNNTVFFGIAYKSKARVTKLSDIGLPVSNNIYYSRYTWFLQNNATYQVYNGYINEPTRWLFNEEKGVGFIILDGTESVGSYNRGTSFFDYTDYFDVNSMSYAIPFLNFSDSEDFWKKLETCANFYIPWQDDVSEKGGGDGEWEDDTNEPISSPSDTDLNTNTIGKTFFATTYKVSFTELKGIAEKLWSTDFLNWVKQYFSNPLEGIINLSMIPVSYTSDDYHSVIIGNYNTNRVGNIVQSQYKTVDCGYIVIPEKWGGAIDYKSRITLYLPFIGSHDLDVIEIIGGRLSVSYIVDLVTGSCVAFVKVKRGDLESVLYQFTGNCAYSMPVTQNSYNSLLSSMLSASAAVAVGVATGGSSTPLMVGAGASVASDARPHVAHSGNLSGNAGYMGIKKPYIILSRPRQSLPQNFGKYIGYQSHITKRLGDCKGFTQIEYIHIDGIENATSEELQEIENLLKSGVIIA